MLSLVRILLVPLISLILTVLGSGLFTTFVSLRLELDGLGNEIIGFVASAFYGGVLMGSLWSPGWIARHGHLKVLLRLHAATTALILVQAFWGNPFFWMAVRFCGGVAMGGLFVVIESWFLLLSSPAMRSRALSLYLAVFYAALSAGQLFLTILNPFSLSPFLLAAAFSVLAIFPLLYFRFPQPAASQSGESFSLIQVFRASPRGFIGGVGSGVVLACIYGLGPAYGREIGLRISEIGVWMATIVLGGVSLQWPLGAWADAQGRRKVLVFASAAAGLIAFAIARLSPYPFSRLLALGWLFGGASFAIYPLSMAHTSESIAESQIVAVTGGFVLSYGLGAILGPLAAPWFMNLLGASGLFDFLALACFAIGAACLVPIRDAR